MKKNSVHTEERPREGTLEDVHLRAKERGLLDLGLPDSRTLRKEI